MAVTDLNLAQDFRAAATGMAEGMAQLRARRGLWRDYPVLDLREWQHRNNNCYNFALNRNAGDYLQPGQLGLGDAYRRPPHLLGFPAYSLSIYRAAEADGLRDLGHEFAAAVNALVPGEKPVALFMTEHQNDYHWISLWRSLEQEDRPLVWAHKPGYREAELCTEKISAWDRTGLFRTAASYGYTHFAGFFAAPLRYQMASEDCSEQPRLARIRHFEP